jgi:hypothetical protein
MIYSNIDRLVVVVVVVMMVDVLPVLRQSGKAKTPRNRRAIFVGLFKSGQTFEKKLNQARSTVRPCTHHPATKRGRK